MYKRVVTIAVSVFAVAIILVGGAVYLLVRGTFSSGTSPSSSASASGSGSTSGKTGAHTGIPGLTAAGPASATTATPTPAPTTDPATGKQSTASLPVPPAVLPPAK